MKSQARNIRVFAAALAALAGFVDALGFLSIGGFFVSFMSGNSTRLAIGVATTAQVALPAGLIASFVVGVMMGDAIGYLRPARRRRDVLVGVSVLLMLASAAAQWKILPLATLLAAAAMGATNAVFAGVDGLPVGITYMTGTLVRLGQSLGARWRGEDRGRSRVYLFHWCALILGGVLGAMVEQRLGLSGLWVATGWATLLVAIAHYQPTYTSLG